MCNNVCILLSRKGYIQPLGHLMVEYPLPPGLSRAVIYSGVLGCHHLLLPVAAMLSSESIFIRPGLDVLTSQILFKETFFFEILKCLNIITNHPVMPIGLAILGNYVHAVLHWSMLFLSVLIAMHSGKYVMYLCV